MNFPSPGDNVIKSAYSLEEDPRQYIDPAAYLLEEQVRHLSLDQHSGVHYEQYLAQNYFAAPQEPFENDAGYSWEPQEPPNLDTVITELSPEEIRWFYKTEGDKRWTEFNGYDSFKIEFEYRQYSHEWHSANYSYECSAETATCADYFQPASSHSEPSEQASLKHKIVVRGGLYEVDLNAWKSYSIFWPGEEFQIQRGTWFYEGTWQPVEYPDSEHIESVHLQLFCGHRLADYVHVSASKPPKEVLHTEKLTEFHVDWHSPSCVFLYSEAAPSKLMRSVTQKLGFQKPSGCRLLRGYKTPASASDTDRPTDITHLVFVIHGIGQKMDTGRIIRNSNSFRDCVTWLQKKYFTKTEHRPEFFPVEWRSALKLDGDLVQAITPLHLDKLRALLNASAMDIMYYTSPLFGKEIQSGLCNELNRLYSMFRERNPYFESGGGKVSIIAHSLGCVIVYDIVTGWVPPNDTSHQSSYRSESSNGGEAAGKSGLLFEIENLFCLGSPLSVFLALRWQDPHKPENHCKVLPPTLCKRLYNMFHPTDPVAYRMEPLLDRAYKMIAPLVMHAYNNGGRTPYELMPLEPLQPDTLRRAPEDKEEPEASAMSPPTPSRDRWSLWNLVRGNSGTPKKSQDGPGSPHQETMLKGLEHRLDYVLRESQLTASYFAAITSHTAYWENYDVAMFILTRLFPELEQQPPLTSSAEGTEPPSPPEFCG